jgi:TolB-like protein/Tfp pilus assembly protein PilF
MSPEQFEGKTIDTGSDVFSLGVILYEMATGRRPFDGSPAPLIAAILNEEPASVTTLNPNLPPELDRLIQQCLEKDPNRRIPSATRAREELETIQRRMEAKTAGVPKAEVEPVAPRQPSIAVLPFANMSADKDQEYFCDGIAEEAINALTQLEGLHVVARTSAFAFKGTLEDIRAIGRKLDVDTVLEGSVRKAGDRLRITTQLVNVADGYHIWSERFDRKAEDVFAIQDEIALAVVEKLRVKLLSGEQGALLRRHTEDRKAYHHYLKGRYFFNRRYEGDFQRAITHFQEAIAHDPVYVLPHVGIADAFNILGIWGFLPPGEAYSRAKAAAERALEIDDTFADAHVAMASELAFYEWDLKRADHHFKRAFELKLSKAIGYTWAGLTLCAREKYDAASAAARRAVELDPLSPIVHTAAASVHVGIGRVDDALGLLEKALELDPSGIMAIAMARLGMREQVLEILRRLDELSTQRYVPFMVKALVHVALGDRDGYIDIAEKARAEREPFCFFLTTACACEGLIPSSWVKEMPQAWEM